jgi:hypothetical protein
MITPPPAESYKEQLVRWSGELAAARTGEVSDALAAGDNGDVIRFLVNSFGDRRKAILDELAFVALAFDDFDEIVQAYLHQVPQRAYDPAHNDRVRFLSWLRSSRPLTDKQHDFVAYQQAEYAVMALARERRAEHVAFQRAWRQVGRHVARLGADPTLRILLNPIRAWSPVALPGRGGETLYFAAGDRVTAAALGPVERDFVDVLARGPCTLARYAGEGTEEVASLCRDRATEGLFAFE